MEPFADGSLLTPNRLRPKAYVLHMALRKTVLPHGYNRESLTSLQQWLLLSIWRGKQFDFLHFFLSKMEDVIADAISTRRQHVYPHIISYLLCMIDSKKNGPLYNESTYEVMTYMLVSPDNHCRGQRTLRSVQELLPIQDRERHKMVDAALEEAVHQSRIGGILNVQMQDSHSNDSDYCDPTSDDHNEGGSSSGGVANKEMDDVPPTTETLAKQAPTPVSVRQPSELGQILAMLVVGQEENQKRRERQDKRME